MSDSEEGSPGDGSPALRLRLAALEAERSRLASEVAALRRAAGPQAPNASEAQSPAALREVRELRLILDSAIGYAIFTTDLAGDITSWNEGARRTLGYAEDEILGRPADLVFVPEDVARGIPKHEMSVALAEGKAEDERWHQRKDGSRLWVSGLMMRLEEDDGRVVGFLKILRDQTEQRMAQEALAAALDYQQALTREASHRVKNSLQLIASMLTLQGLSARQPEVRRALEDATARISTVATVHDRLWRNADVRAMEMASFLEDFCAELAQTSPGCRLICQADAVTLPADRAIPLALIVNELVTNAFKHGCPAGGEEVRVRLTRSGTDGLRLEVSDDGPGLPQGFDPRSATRSLGMRLVAGLAGQLRARLEIATGGPGARFVLTLPLAQEAEERPPPPARSDSPATRD